MLGWDHAGGFSLDISVRIAAHDRAGLERLLRYCARPPAIHPARGPPELEFGFAEPAAGGMDQTPAVDPAEPEPIPPYEMDQTQAW